MRKQYTRSLFKATENIPHTPGSSLSPFLPSNGSAVKTSTCVATHPGRPAIRRPRPNIPLCLARYLGIRLMYAPPYRHVPHVPTRPLVIRSSLCFPGETLYRADMRRNLRRRIIMDIAQLLSGLALIPPFSFLAGKLIVGKFIDAPLWGLILIISQPCIIYGLTYTRPFRSFYMGFANWWMRRFPHA